MEKKISSVNFHLWQPCNMACKFCFASFNDIDTKEHMSKEQCLLLIDALADFGFKKTTFVGGEPTLCPWLFDLVKRAKEKGFQTMIVTNGSLVDELFLENYKGILDWIGLSIDSLSSKINYKIGRSFSSKVLQKTDYRNLVNLIKKKGYKLKINTVVNRFNFMEDMNDFISFAQPDRWKVMQVLAIKGQNDKHITSYTISSSEFESFLERHKSNLNVRESNEEMINSYVMIDPLGRFFNNEKGEHKYSESILKNGVRLSYMEMNYNYSRFVNRGGLY